MRTTNKGPSREADAPGQSTLQNDARPRQPSWQSEDGTEIKLGAPAPPVGAESKRRRVVIIAAVLLASFVYTQTTNSRYHIVRVDGRMGWSVIYFPESWGTQLVARVAPLVGMAHWDAPERLPSTLAATYAAMERDRVPGQWFRFGAADAMYRESTRRFTEGHVGVGIVFLHGSGGAFASECWAVAEAFPEAQVICPSAGTRGNWESAQHRATIDRALTYLETRGACALFVIGLSRGAMALAQFNRELTEQHDNVLGTILIAGAFDGDARAPSLVLYGEQDQMLPRPWIDRYCDTNTTAICEAVPGTHFFLFEHRPQVQARMHAFVASELMRRSAQLRRQCAR